MREVVCSAPRGSHVRHLSDCLQLPSRPPARPAVCPLGGCSPEKQGGVHQRQAGAHLRSRGPVACPPAPGGTARACSAPRPALRCCQTCPEDGTCPAAPAGAAASDRRMGGRGGGLWQAVRSGWRGPSRERQRPCDAAMRGSHRAPGRCCARQLPRTWTSLRAAATAHLDVAACGSYHAPGRRARARCPSR